MMKGLLSGLKSESILCDAAAASAEDEAASSTRSPLRMPSSLQNVSTGSIHTSSGSASSSSATATRSAIAAASDVNEATALTDTIMALKLEMAELRTSLDATSNRESKLRAANADLEDRCNRLAAERDKFKSKLRKAVDALSQSRTRIKDMERNNAELRARLEATEAERNGAKRERRSVLGKLLASASFDDGYASIFDNGDSAIARNIRSLTGISSDGAGSDMACATHNDSLSVEDLSWPSQDERQALKEMRSRQFSTKVDENTVAEDMVADDKNEDDDGDNSIQPTSEILGNDSRNTNSSHDTARDVELFFDMFKANDDDSLGSEDVHHHEPRSKSNVSKSGNVTSKGDANSASSHYSLEGGKVPLKRMPRRNSCDAQAA